MVEFCKGADLAWGVSNLLGSICRKIYFETTSCKLEGFDPHAWKFWVLGSIIITNSSKSM